MLDNNDDFEEEFTIPQLKLVKKTAPEELKKRETITKLRKLYGVRSENDEEIFY